MAISSGPERDSTFHVLHIAQTAKSAASALAAASASERNKALEAMAAAIMDARDDILFKNEIDVEAGRASGLADALIDRLTLTQERVSSMAECLRAMAALPDPLAEAEPAWSPKPGLSVKRLRVPLGVVAMIYESRPNVTVDSAGLCLKSGNAVILRGGKEAMDSNRALVNALAPAIARAGLPEGCVQLVETSDREVVRKLCRLDKWIDLVIPRGGEAMVRAIREAATVPVLSHGQGICAVYVDKAADLKMAEDIAFNAKVHRPGVCNAMETLLVHEAVAERFLPGMVRRYREAGVEVRGDEEVRRLAGAEVRPASEEDWDTEFLSLVCAVAVIPSLDAAIQHINTHGSHHSDAIVTSDADAAGRFQREVDSAAVFHNASTRLHDGGVFGFGAEMGISTQKLHARGTMGLRELTTTKYVVTGQGHIRS